ncbi:MAG: branched-chain amino acid ABC transporter permease [Burkholderiaceae bacterium]|nr:branched-chain amino acid ABC transporter permease [Burkholderiaceae bacterium]
MSAPELLQQVVNGLAAGSVYVLIGLGLSLVFGVLGIAHFAHGSVAMLGGYATLNIMQGLGYNLWLAMLLAMPLAAVLGVIIERLFYRPVRNAPPINTFIIALGLMFILDNAALLFFGPEQVLIRSPYTSVVSFGTFNVVALRIYMLACNVLLLVALVVLLSRTKLGRAIRAVAQNRDAAAMLGVNVDRVSAAVFAIGSALAASAGAFVGSLTALYPSMSGDLVLKGFAVMILGGMGSLPGAVLGGLIIGVTESLGGALISSAYKGSFGFIILILVLWFRPSGMFGKDV